MSKSLKKNETNIGFQLKNIEILNVDITFPGHKMQENTTYHYNINIQHKINVEDRLILVDTSIDTMHQDKKTRLGHIKVTCIYYIESLLNYKSERNDQLIELPEQLIIKLNSLAISTTRGVMFSQFRGTFLHNAILPIFDPTKLKSEQ